MYIVTALDWKVILDKVLSVIVVQNNGGFHYDIVGFIVPLAFLVFRAPNNSPCQEMRAFKSHNFIHSFTERNFFSCYVTFRPLSIIMTSRVFVYSFIFFYPLSFCLFVAPLS